MGSGGENTAEEKRQSKLDGEEKYRECRNRETAEKRGFLHAGKEIPLVDSKISWSRNRQIQSISVAFESGKEMPFIDSKVSTQAHPKIVSSSDNLNTVKPL